MSIKDKYKFKNKFDSMAGGSSGKEVERISSKCKREYRTCAGKKKNAERHKEMIRRSAWGYCRKQVKYAVRIPSRTAVNDKVMKAAV